MLFTIGYAQAHAPVMDDTCIVLAREPWSARGASGVTTGRLTGVTRNREQPWVPRRLAWHRATLSIPPLHLKA